MTTFTVDGKELLIKEAKKHGSGGMIYVPKAWIGQKVGIIRGIKE